MNTTPEGSTGAAQPAQEELSLRPETWLKVVASTLFFGPIFLRPPFLAWAACWGVLAMIVWGYRQSLQNTQLRLNEQAAGLVDSAARPFVLYLRPFFTAGQLPVANPLHGGGWILMGRYWDVELALSLALEKKGFLVAIGETPESLGAVKLTTSDASWKDVMRKCADRALAIVIVPYDRPSTAWEVEFLFRAPNLLRKTLFLMPPLAHFSMRDLFRRLAGNSLSQRWTRAVATYAARGITLPSGRYLGCWFRMNEDGKVAATFPLNNLQPEPTWNLLNAASRVAADQHDDTLETALRTQAEKPAASWGTALGRAILFVSLAIATLIFLALVLMTIFL